MISERGGGNPPSLSSLPFPPEVGPLNPGRGLGRRSHNRKRLWCTFAYHLTSGGKQFSNFTDNQLRGQIRVV